MKTAMHKLRRFPNAFFRLFKRNVETTVINCWGVRSPVLTVSQFGLAVRYSAGKQKYGGLIPLPVRSV